MCNTTEALTDVHGMYRDGAGSGSIEGWRCCLAVPYPVVQPSCRSPGSRSRNNCPSSLRSSAGPFTIQDAATEVAMTDPESHEACVGELSVPKASMNVFASTPAVQTTMAATADSPVGHKGASCIERQPTCAATASRPPPPRTHVFYVAAGPTV